MKKKQKLFTKKSTGSGLFLAMIGVIMILPFLVALLQTVKTEQTTTDVYTTTLKLKQLADSAINMVMGQITTATSQSDPGSDEFIAWASQPGMIRTYDQTGEQYKMFKLYSWDDMVFDATLGSDFNPFDVEELPPVDWDDLPMVYVDMNEPVNEIYPIMDPDSVESGIDGVKGFSIDDTDPAVAGKDNLAPMPVQWLYVLEDGSVVRPEITGDGVELDNVTPTNRVMGRVAFWTDDETAKVNINTASHGNFWDVPTVTVPQEQWGEDRTEEPWGFSTSLPTYDEYQRLNGHPATTSLEPVLGDLIEGKNWASQPSDYEDYMAPFYGLTPRIAPGGSRAGLDYIDGMGGSGAAAINLFLDADRLYVSPAELLFPPDRDRDSTATNGSLPEYVGVEREFFLSTHSRAPEENLFNLPRLTLWPLQLEGGGAGQTGVRNAKDRLIAFVSELGEDSSGDPFRYYFQRYNAFMYDGTNYLNEPSSAMSPTQDLANVQRNQDLLDYLNDLWSKPVPGFSGSATATLRDKWGEQDTEQMLTQTFDFIRSGANTISVALEPKYHYTNFRDQGATDQPGRGFVMPIQRSVGTQVYNGFGRAPIIQEVALVFYAADWIDEYTLGDEGFDTVESSVEPINQGKPFYISRPNGSGAVRVVNFPRKSGPDGVPDDVPETLFLRNNEGDRIDEKGRVEDPNNETAAGPGAPDPAPWETVEYYDGIGDPQTEVIGAFLLVDVFTPNGGMPDILHSYRYRVDGLDELEVGVGVGGARYFINGPGPNDSVLVNRGAANLIFNDMGFHDFFTWNTGDGKVGKKFGWTDGRNSGVGRTVEHAQMFPWITNQDELIAGTLPTLDPDDVDPVPWKLNRFGQYKTESSGRYGGERRVISNSGEEVAVGAIQTMEFQGVDLVIEVYPGLTDSWNSGDLLKTYNFKFPRQVIPVPQIYRESADRRGGRFGMLSFYEYDFTEEGENGNLRETGGWPEQGAGGHEDWKGWAIRDLGASLGDFTPSEPGASDNEEHEMAQKGLWASVDYDSDEARRFPDFYYGVLRSPVKTGTDGGGPRSPDAAMFYDPRHWSGRAPANYLKNTLFRRPGPDNRGPKRGPNFSLADNGISTVRRGDVVRSLVVNAAEDSPTRGDLRLIAPLSIVDEDYYARHPLYDEEQNFMAHSMGYMIRNRTTFGFNQDDTNFAESSDTNPQEWEEFHHGETKGTLVPGINFKGDNFAGVTPNMGLSEFSDADSWGEGAMMRVTGNPKGDFHQGLGNTFDGPHLSKPDEAYGNLSRYANIYFPLNRDDDQAFGRGEVNVTATFSPNRQIASAVLMGSLPTGVYRQMPWQTLLFNPRPSAGDSHPGFGTGSGGDGPEARAPFSELPEHLFLDFFNMPVSEPYPISERFSTAGKINLNYAIMPFSYIERSTGIYAVLQNAKVMAVPNAAAEDNRDASYNGWRPLDDNEDASAMRFDINVEETLEGFRRRFEDRRNPDIFRSASEITTIHMVPQEPDTLRGGFRYETPSEVYGPEYGTTGLTYDGMDDWWENFQVTGDDSRESVYNQIYPRVTTKSNTFRVHYRVQVLKTPVADPARLEPQRVSVDGELRGSAVIERYLDPNARNIPDYATSIAETPLQSFYRWRVVSNQQFKPNS